MQLSTRIAAVSLFAAVIASPALAQFNICTAETDGTFTPHFNVAPSMVVTNGAILDATRGDLGLTGDAAERAFSFRRTISSILESAGGDTGTASQVDFVQTMLDTLVPGATFPLNAAAGVRMPLDGRSEQSTLNAAQMLDETSALAMKPLALFNRFDAAPDNWSHCGEHRIVYGRDDPNAATDGRRFLLIFEAMVPNPGTGPAGCKPIAEFWANLSEPSLADTDLATRLSAFYYDGKTSPGLASPDLLTPVVDYRNYGGDGGRGQVRANAFMTPPWQLREWLTQRTFNPGSAGLPLTFVPVTVKDNPLPELYHDDLAGSGFLANNPASSANLLHGQFLQALTGTIAGRLLSEVTPKHQLLANELILYHLGSGPELEVSPETVLLNTFALGNDDKFNEFQSQSQTFVDAPGQPPGSSTMVTSMLDQVAGTPNPFVNQQTGEILLNRARAATCGGCHMSASRSLNNGFGLPGVVVLRRPDGTELRWPDVAPGGFVQVTEDRVLSPTLLNALLPFRRYVMSRFLCETSATSPNPGTPEPGTYEPYGDMPEPQVVARAVGPDLVDQVGSGGHFVDRLIGEFAAGAGVPQTVGQDAPLEARTAAVTDAIDELSPEALAALRQKVSDAIALARSIEQQRSGAFVETRRPH